MTAYWRRFVSSRRMALGRCRRSRTATMVVTSGSMTKKTPK